MKKKIKGHIDKFWRLMKFTSLHFCSFLYTSFFYHSKTLLKKLTWKVKERKLLQLVLRYIPIINLKKQKVVRYIYISFINWYDTIDDLNDTTVDVYDDIIIEESSDEDNFQPIIRRKRKSMYNHNNNILKLSF
jgi:hypothetical protein